MGEVFLAHDTILDRNVAIKFLPKELQDDISFRERFFREAKAAAALDHPFICKIYETGEVQDKAYIVMEYIDGKNLKQKMEEEPLSLKETLRITSEIAEALEKAHSKGIVHRDLKPANIMLTPQGRVKIMDFGLAKKVLTRADFGVSKRKRPWSARKKNVVLSEDMSAAKTIVDQPKDQDATIIDDFDADKTIIDTSTNKDNLKDIRVTDVSKVALQSSLTQYGTLVGTLAYMSPEQAKGDTVDVRSDIFALGIMLYEMIAKKHPFLRSNPSETLSSILHDSPPPLKIKPKKLIGGLTPILRKALAKNVEQRHQTIQDFTRDLQKMQKVLHIGSPLFYLSKPAIISFAAIFMLIITGTFWIARRGRVSASELTQEPVSVLVSDFQNITGDPVFDGALEQALNIGLEGASFITTYQRPDARKIAREVNPDSGGRLDVQMAQLVSIREGINKFIGGSIEPKDKGYILKIWVRDPIKSEDVKEYSKKVKSKDDVLNTAAWLANKVRSNLGDVSADAKKALQGETFTTSSLEAMKAYTRAQEMKRLGRKDEAITEYLKAIAADNDFGRAYAGLALVYQNRGQYEEAEKYFQEALARIDRMSEREKYRTRTIYYLIHRNIQQAIEECTELVTKYPADFAGHTNLALAYFFAHNYSKAKEVGRSAMDLYPKIITPRFNLSWYALADGDFEMAEQEAQNLREINSEFEEVYVVLALAKLAQGQNAEAAEIYTNLQTGSPEGEALASLGMADIAMFEGRLSEAIRILKERIARDQETNQSEHSGNKRTLLAQAHFLRGEHNLALEAVERAMASSQDTGTLFISAQIFIGTGKEARAKEIASELNKKLGPEPKAYAMLITGEIEKTKGDIQSAIAFFMEAQSILDTWLGRLALGKAYIEIEAYPEAHSEFDSCLKRRGEATSVFFDDTPTYHCLPPVYYYLGRTQEGIGSPAAAESYRKFLEIKEKEDWGDPLVKDARRRLAVLSNR